MESFQVQIKLIKLTIKTEIQMLLYVSTSHDSFKILFRNCLPGRVQI